MELSSGNIFPCICLSFSKDLERDQLLKSGKECAYSSRKIVPEKHCSFRDIVLRKVASLYAEFFFSVLFIEGIF